MTMHDDYVLESQMEARKAQQAFVILCWKIVDSHKIETTRQRIIQFVT